MSNKIPVGGKVFPKNPKPTTKPTGTMSGDVLPHTPKPKTTPNTIMSGKVAPKSNGKKAAVITAAVALASLGLGFLTKNKSDKTSDK